MKLQKSVSEDSGVNLTLLTVVASDDDAGPMGEMTYSIAKGKESRASVSTTTSGHMLGEDLFRIDAETGHVVATER